MAKKGKGGFADHPENINKGGRPIKGTAIADILRLILEGKEDTIPETPKKQIAMKMYKKALSEDNAKYLRYVLSYHDGIPAQKVIHSGDEEQPVRLIIED